jgi:hypothetical protein
VLEPGKTLALGGLLREERCGGRESAARDGRDRVDSRAHSFRVEVSPMAASECLDGVSVAKKANVYFVCHFG